MPIEPAGDPKYWQAFDLEARFVNDRFLDRKYGEVYTAIYHDGRIDDEKVGPWKAPSARRPQGPSGDLPRWYALALYQSGWRTYPSLG